MVREGVMNGRWSGREEYLCPVCGTVMLLTPFKAARAREKGLTCSHTCGMAKFRGVKRGPNPGSAAYMRENNPMHKPEVAARVGATLRERHAKGELDHVKAKLRETGRHNLIAYNKSEQGRNTSTQRMTSNNPMKDPAVAKRVSDNLKQQYGSGQLTGFWKGKTKPDAKERMLSDKNPMKDPDIRRETLRKIIAAHVKRGISHGEELVKAALEYLQFDYVHQYLVQGPRRCYVLDFFLPSLQWCIEYDGHSGHYTEKGIARDIARDAYVLEHTGLKTLRIHRDAAFIGIENLANLICKGVGYEDKSRN